MKRLVVLAVAVFATGILSTTQAEPSQVRKVLPGHIPPAVGYLTPLGRLPAARSLRLAIGLPPRNRQSLSNFLSAVYDPASPLYRHFLTPQQFTERFGPTPAEYQQVMEFARTNGLSVVGTHPNRLLLDVTGSVANIEKAFHVTLLVYQHPTEAREFYAPDTNPSVAAGLPVADVTGLNNYMLPHPLNHKRTDIRPQSNATPNAGSAGGAYRGNDFRAAYVPGVTLDGSGQAVGLLQFDGFYSADIATYESQAGITNVPLTTVLLDGFNGSPGVNNVEVALDIEMAISMAPGLSQVIVYEAGPYGYPNDILNRMATDDLAKQLSSSWTWGTIPDSTTDTIFQELASQGQSFFQASGDSGAYTSAVDQPADNPYITVVGGTTLSTAGPNGPWAGETTWNWYNTGIGTAGTGGGISTYYSIPDWQLGIDMSTNQGSTSQRNIPDVALTADDVYVVYDNGSSGVFGGTSCATPLWAGFMALVNQQAQSAGQPTIGFANPTIYSLAKGPDYNLLFHDITTGNNTNTSSPNLFYARPGYDLCTGWGTPAGQYLINALTGPLDSLQLRPTVGFTANGPIGGPFDVNSQTFTLTNAGTNSLEWSLDNPAAWLGASAIGGTMAAGASQTVTVNLNSAIEAFGAGVFSAGVVFSNMTSGIAQTRQFTVRVGQSLVRNGGFETGSFSDWLLLGTGGYNLVATDSFAVHSGTYGAELGQVGLPLGTLSQSLPTEAGQPYLLSLWLGSSLHHPRTTPNQFTVSWNGSILLNQTNIPTIGWTNIRYLVTATTSATPLQFGFRDDPWYLGLDDISVTPVPRPALHSSSQTNGKVTLNWLGTAGLSYQVQFKTNLAQNAWINLGTPITATNSTPTSSDNIGPDPQRFYRVILLPQVP